MKTRTRCISYWLLLCLLSTILYAEKPEEDLLPSSTPEQVAALHAVAPLRVGDLVNPLSGQLSLSRVDLIAKGAQDIVLQRHYIPPHIPALLHSKSAADTCYLYQHLNRTYRGWVVFPHRELRVRANVAQLTYPNGSTLDVVLSTQTLKDKPYGISNAQGETPSGRYDLRNTRISLEGPVAIVQLPDGRKLHYRKAISHYLLEKEIILNGKILRYAHDADGRLTRIDSLDPKERYLYASLHVEGDPKEGTYGFTNDANQSVTYHYQSTTVIGKWKEKQNGKRHKSTYQQTSPPILTSVQSPYDQETIGYPSRFLLSNYESHDQSIQCRYATVHTTNDPVDHYRVHALELPVGSQDCFHPLYTFSYDPAIPGKKGGSTTAINCDGTVQVYHFSKNLLLEKLQQFGPDKQLKLEHRYSFSDQNWLLFVEVSDDQGQLLYRKDFVYDSFGNPIQETFSGRAIEPATTKRLFSEDGFHLLLQEVSPSGQVTTFQYLKETNLLTAKLTADSTKIYKREFFFYDDCHNLIRELVDNGSETDPDNLTHVTQRTITQYLLRQEAPFLHKVEWKEQKFLEQGQEHLLTRTHFHYDPYGNICQEDLYDASNQLTYSLYRTYNARGELLSETNPLGEVASYSYDEKGRCIAETQFSGLTYERRYDTTGRLIEEKQIGRDSLMHTKQFAYDPNDHLVCEVDPFGNATHYSYDPITHQVTRTEYPASDVVTHSSYDPLGCEISRTDPHGHCTLIAYNAYGSPVEIVHPNGGKERFAYSNGRCIRHTDPDGRITTYQYDTLGRLLSRRYLSEDGIQLAEEIFQHDGLALLQTSNREGLATAYHYDGAGRKIAEKTGDKQVTYQFDALGRVATRCDHNRENSIWTHYTYDLLSRLIEERKTDNAGTLLYRTSRSYDSAGNVQSVTRYIGNQVATTTFEYDSFNRLIAETDPLGHTTRTHYDEQQRNASGQRLLQTTKTDPLSLSTIVTYDVLNRPVKRQVIDATQNVLSCQEMRYDPCGNLLERRDLIYLDGQYQKTQTIRTTYTPAQLIQSVTRAADTPESRTTSYRYTLGGMVASKTNPDGITLSYGYDGLGNRRSLRSSDRQLSLSFVHNRMGQLIQMSDERQQITIQRRLDPYGNLLSEQFPSGLQIDKRYDLLDRTQSIHLPGQGIIEYGYSPLSLSTVSRLNSSGVIQYQHQYQSYDLEGNLALELLPFGLGHVHHETDPKGRPFGRMSRYLHQHCHYDADDNLIETTLDEASSSYTYDGLSQLNGERTSRETHRYVHDSNYNRVSTNGEPWEVNELSERLSGSGLTCGYDRNGNLLTRQTPTEEITFSYDALNRLTQVMTSRYKLVMTYDPIGRRLSKTSYLRTDSDWHQVDQEYYLYDGENEIGAFTDEGQPKQLRILGLARHKNVPATVAIERRDQCYVPILDCQGNIRRLVDPVSQQVVERYDFSAFGQETTSSPCPLNPWRYASKRTDAETGLVDFGKRFYDPQMSRWLTTDPAGFVDSTNLYVYLLNNPFKYVDPDGRFVFVLPLFTFGAAGISWALPSLATFITSVVITSAATYSTYLVLREFSNFMANELGELGEPPHSGVVLGDNPSICPGEGFKWKGRGPPSSGEGAWHNEDNGHRWHPDLKHPPPIKPHWDFKDNNGKKGRYYLDGTWEWKE